MNLIESMLTENPCYKTDKKIDVKGLMLHSVGCPQPKATVFVKDWNRGSFSRACVHAFIDANTGTIYQTLPWNHRGWHGGGTSNSTHIGVEMCEPSCIKYVGGNTVECSDVNEAVACVKRTYEAAVELFAMLCEKYNLDPLADGVIVSHSEGHKLGIASNHGDPEHLWTQLNTGYTMDKFRQDVKREMSNTTVAEKKEETTPVKKWYRVRKSWKDAKSQLGAYENINGAKKVADENPGYSVFDNDGKVVYSPKTVFEPYSVRVTITNLNIRTGPGTNHEKTGRVTGRGVFTIVEEKAGEGSKAGWGRLKSGAGWISLDYATRLG